MPKKHDNKPVVVTISLPRELADACLALAEDPHEFRWGAFFRSLARAHLAKRKVDPKARLAAFATLNK